MDDRRFEDFAAYVRRIESRPGSRERAEALRREIEEESRSESLRAGDSVEVLPVDKFSTKRAGMVGVVYEVEDLSFYQAGEKYEYPVYYVDLGGGRHVVFRRKHLRKIG